MQEESMSESTGTYYGNQAGMWGESSLSHQI